MLCSRCTGIYKFGNNTYPQCIRCRSNLGHIFQEKKVCLMGREIQYMLFFFISCCCPIQVYAVDPLVLPMLEEPLEYR